MHTYVIQKATTSVSIELEIIDSTDGTPETGVVWNTSGIDLQYRRDGAASTSITEATLAALTTAHTDGGFLHIGNGVYRFDLPDAACATGVDKVVVHGTVTGMVVIPCVIQLVSYDPFDAVRMGMTALPNAAADAAGGLPISDAGGLDLDTILDVAVSTRLAPTVASRTLDVTATGAAGIDWGNIENVTTTVGFTNTTVGTVTTNTDMRGTDSALLASSAPTNFSDLSIAVTTGLVDITQTAADKAWSTASRTVTAATNITSDASAITMSSSGVVGTVNLVNTTTTNTDMVAAAPTAAANADAVWDETMASHTTADTAGLVMNEWQDGGRLDVILDSRMAEASINTTAGAIDNVTAVATTTTNTDMVAEPTTLLTTQMTESYAADGVAPTVAQALFAIQQFLQERDTATTTVTVKRLDGSTTAMTFTLDDATTPTSITRAT